MFFSFFGLSFLLPALLSGRELSGQRWEVQKVIFPNLEWDWEVFIVNQTLGAFCQMMGFVISWFALTKKQKPGVAMESNSGRNK